MSNNGEGNGDMPLIPDAQVSVKAETDTSRRAKPSKRRERQDTRTAPARLSDLDIAFDSMSQYVRQELGRLRSDVERVAEPRIPLIFSAMRAVMRDIVPLAKTHEHPDEGFDFRKIDEVCARLQPLLVEHGIVYTPEVLSKVEVERRVVTDSGQSWVNIFSTVTVAWHIRSAFDGSKWPDPCVTIGEGMSEQHFSTNAALTMAEKAMLTKVFCIPVYGADDPEEIRGERSQSSSQPVYTTPEARSPSTPSLFGNEDEDFSPPFETASSAIKEPKPRRTRKPQEPQVSAVGGAQLPDQVNEENAQPATAVVVAPLADGFIRILKNNLEAKKVSEESLFAHFQVTGYQELSAVNMDEALAFIQKGPQS